MSLLFDALKRAQDTEDRPAHSDDRQFTDQSEPEVITQPSANLTMETPDREVGAFAAQSIFAATARQSRRIAALAVCGVVLLLLTAGGGFWYYKRTTALVVSPAPTSVVPPDSVKDDMVPPAQLPEKLQAPETSGEVSAEQVQAEMESVTQETLSPPPAEIPAQGALIADAKAGSESTAGHARLASTERKEPVPAKTGQTTANLASLKEKICNEEEAPSDKAQSRSQAPPQTRQPEHPESTTPPSRPVANNFSESHIRLSVSGDPLRDGYQALVEGRLDDAERLYKEVISKRPHERDALLGLAVIAHRQRQLERAVDLYRQVLREDPGNATATAALVNLSVQVDPAEAESRLRQLLDQNPTSPELHHALGSVLVRQKRWEEAQQVFFQAYSLEPGNALYAYNLAVALDRLHKSAAALTYYEKSLQLLKPGDAAINRDTIQRRMQELRRILPEQR